MSLRLDPRLPLVWRSPHSLQFGVDDPAVVIEDVTTAQERMIAALSRGVGRGALGMVAVASGADDAEADRLVETVGPALEAPVPTVLGKRVAVAGRGQTIDRLVGALTASGVLVIRAGDDRSAAAEPADVAVVVAHYVIAPDYYGLWLRRDQTHLPVVWGDTGSTIGPFVEPGSGPCLYCLERDRTDADPAWPAIASQLWGRRSPLDAGVTADETAAVAARLVLTRLLGGPLDSALQTRVDGRSGIRTTTPRVLHPECGCAALPGTETAAAAPIESVAPAPTTAAADAWLA